MVTAKRILTATIAGLLLAAAGCGSNAGSGQQNAPGTLDVGVVASLSSASYYEAEAEGAFKKAGLTTKSSLVASGQQAVPLLLNGQIQFASSDVSGVMTAVAARNDVVMVASASACATTAATDPTGVMVAPKSGITSARQLSGKTVAIVALRGQSQMTVQAAVDNDGGDSSTIKFVELPITGMVDALKAGTVDAALLTEPFTTVAKSAGLKVLFAPFSASTPGVPQVVYMATRKWVDSHPVETKAFYEAITSANETLSANPEKIVEIGLKHTEVPEKQLRSMALPVFEPSTIQLDAVKSYVDLMVKYGYLKSPIDAAKYIYQPR
ncbi:ABC transporter substrate-binding protein [Amycolatopsis pithecellobii]|uniref:Solute-binding protein family 3/N-terminal domain-containing protein n=1 Tax=Amycolatopsis pithecellobii TaxID=664692 RepID=A0A6N7ZBY5_9PSEU|nr:ABC transporter substrate-binding protein [Amycolatopsis pithecellobii]MTD59215.1 hypothetical protein [Amycolatopsis pithecellobii]